MPADPLNVSKSILLFSSFSYSVSIVIQFLQRPPLRKNTATSSWRRNKQQQAGGFLHNCKKLFRCNVARDLLMDSGV